MSTNDPLTTAIDALTAKVTAEDDIIDSAVVLINGLAAQIRSVAGNVTKANALADMVQSKADALAAAVAANTPAQP